MTSLLIGSTGFVGSNLAEQGKFDAFANSKNILEFNGQRFDEVVVAAGDARKWLANKEPDADRLHIEKLADDIKSVITNRIILFSTVDVYGEKIGDEQDVSSAIRSEPYGINRYWLEREIVNSGVPTQVIRLPALFGNGLKKNLIYDYIHARDLSGFNPNSRFQWFDLSRLKGVMELVKEKGIAELNVCSEPISVQELITSLGGGKLGFNAPLVSYDIRTRFGDDNQYLFCKDQILSEIITFVERWRNK